MESSLALELTSRYVAALAARDTDQMNALRDPDFVLDFVYGDATESGPLSSEETKHFWPSWLAGFPEMDYEVTRTVALAVRLFGNIMSLEMAALLILWVAGLLAPVPILMLHIIEALVQAYIFGMLALVYIAGGLQSQQLRQQKDET